MDGPTLKTKKGRFGNETTVGVGRSGGPLVENVASGSLVRNREGVLLVGRWNGTRDVAGGIGRSSLRLEEK